MNSKRTHTASGVLSFEFLGLSLGREKEGRYPEILWLGFGFGELSSLTFRMCGEAEESERVSG